MNNTMNATNSGLPVYSISICFNNGSVLEFETTWFSYYPDHKEIEYERRDSGPVFIDMKSIVAINITKTDRFVDPVEDQQIVRIP